MSKYIDADALLNQRPENLNNRCENYDKAVYASGWNDCNECWCDLIDGMPAADVEPVKRWISVDERMPEAKKRWHCTVIVANEKGDVMPMLYENTIVRGKEVCRWKYVYDRIYDDYPITHWMPLPEAPNKNLTKEKIK